MSDEKTLLTDDFYALKDIDLYSVLCITIETFTPEIVKKKYRKLSIKYHPDKNFEEGASDKFTLIQLAYSILSNQQKRAMYDLVRASECKIETFEKMKMSDKNIINIPQISDDEFVRKINKYNEECDEDYDKHSKEKTINKGKMSDIEASNLVKLNRNADLLTEDMKTKFQDDYNKLKNINDEQGRADAFNAMFDVAHVDEEDESQDMMLYNGNTMLMNNAIATTDNYDSMFHQGLGTYEDSFKIKSANLKETIDDRSYEEQIKEYENGTQELYELSKTSTLKEGRADFRFDHV